jgi:hypothetical protein
MNGDADVETGVCSQYDVTHTKFRCESCGDTYVFVELGDWPTYCPTCGHNHSDQERAITDGGQCAGGTDRLHLDLCCGLGGWGAPFREADDWRSAGLDIRADLEADVVGDVRSLPFSVSPTLLTMSPPCTEFSRYSMPWLDEPNPDMSLVEACLDAVQELRPTWWVLENVRGLKQYWSREEAVRVGPYYLWGEFPFGSFNAVLPDGGKMSVSGERPEERAEIPYALADSLRRAVEWNRRDVDTDTDRSEGGEE